MRVLVACEFSGAVRSAFRALGHDAWSCDILPAEDGSPHHYQCDVFEVLSMDWNLMVAHPPCTFLSNSGVCWLKENPERLENMRKGALFFRSLLEAPIRYKAIENPIMHKYAVDIIGRRQDQAVQPWMFGHMERKATCLWLDGLPPLVPTNNVKEEMLKLPKNKQQRLHYLPPSADRQKERSRTYQGIADAMAAQWGNINQENTTKGSDV